MVMTASRVVALCEQSAAAIREDLTQIETGDLSFQSRRDGDVTDWHLSRMRAALSCLQDIIDGCGCECS
jgi:hypothetical protein